MTTTVFEGKVSDDWVDYNGHMNDAAYARVFSLSVDQFMIQIGIDETFRKEQQYTIYTLENHICYLAELFRGAPFHTTIQLLDHDEKLIHVFFEMRNEAGEKLATSEQMLIGIDEETGRPKPFPSEIKQTIQTLAKEHGALPTPKEAGRKIGIKKK